MKICWHKYKLVKAFGGVHWEDDPNIITGSYTCIFVYRCDKCGKFKIKYTRLKRNIAVILHDECTAWIANEENND